MINNTAVKDNNRLFGTGRFYKSALTIAVPIMLQALIQSLVSLVDNFMVSGLGDICPESMSRDRCSLSFSYI